MNYKDVFVFQTDNEELKQYCLTDYDDLLSTPGFNQLAFESDFYLRVLIKKVLFEMPIYKVEKFLEFQLLNSKDYEDCLKILENEVVPSIKNIIKEAQIDMLPLSYYNENLIKGSFVESEGYIKNSEFEYKNFYHRTAFDKQEENFNRIVAIVNNCLDHHNLRLQDLSFKWIAGPSQLAVIIIELFQSGYIEVEKYRGEINKRKLAISLVKALGINDEFEVKSLENYLNENQKKYSDAKKKFQDANFKIPLASYTI